MPPERPAAAHQVLPHPRLRFVDAERNGLAQRQAELIGRQALLVNAVPRLVQRAEEGRVEEVLVVARRDAAVVRPERRAERMRRDVNPPAVELETDRRGRRLAEGFLRVHGKLASQERNVRAALACSDGRHERHELLAKVGQHAGDVRGDLLRLVIVQEGVVAASLVTQGVGLLPLELEGLREPRQKMSEVILPPGFFPGTLPKHGRSRQFFDEALRQLGFLIDLPLDAPDRDGPFAILFRGQRPRRQLGHFGHESLVGPALVGQTREKRRLLGAVLGVGRGHLRPLVPIQDRRRWWQADTFGERACKRHRRARRHCRAWAVLSRYEKTPA